MIKKSFLIFLCLLLLSAFEGLYAGGLQINYQSIRQSGMGHVGIGLSLDASSIFFNPGSLAMNYKGGILLGSSVLSPKIQYAGDYFAETDSVIFTPIYLYAAFKGKEGSFLERFSFGISLNNPFGGTVKWQDDWNARNISQEFSLNTFFIQPTIAFKLTENIGIGAGLSYGITNLLSRRVFNQIVDGSVQYTGAGISLGFNLGIFAQATPEISIGLSFRSKLEVGIKDGEVQFSDVDALTDL
ncbi:MAG: outer membrane protein transport protein, partial [Bacteroidota bacterium]